jgi:hypothetical protein
MSRPIRWAPGALATPLAGLPPGVRVRLRARRPLRLPVARRTSPLAGLLVALLALLAAELPGWGLRAAELQIEAPRFTFDQAKHTYTYEDGRLTLGALTLFASHMELNTDTGLMHATGFIRVQTAELAGIAESAELDANSRVGTLHGASLHLTKGGLYVRAKDVVIRPDGTLLLRSCTVTSCPPEVPGAWQLAASSMSLESDGVGVAWNPRVSLGPVPVLWLPIMAWPTVHERRSGLLTPELSDDRSSLPRFNLGWRLRLPLFVNMGYDNDLTLTPEPIQHRGTALGLEYNYAFTEGQLGRLRWWGIQERDPRQPLQENDILTPQGIAPPTQPLPRYELDWGHNESLGQASRLVLSYHDSSDGQVRREYSDVTEYRPYHTYQASLTSQGDWATGALTFEQNADFTDESVYARTVNATDLHERPQLLPRVGTHLGGRPLPGLPLTLGLDLAATHFRAPSVVSGDLYEASPTLSVPLSLGGAFELRPSLTRYFVGYTGLTQGPGQTPLDPQSFSQTAATLELRTALARVYTPDSGRYAALKHRIVPRLIFTAVQDVPQPALLADEVLRSRVAERLITLRLDNDLLGRAAAPAAAGGSDAAGPSSGTASGALPAAAFPPADSGALATDLLSVNLIQRYNLLRRPGAPALQGPAPGDPPQGSAGPALPQETEPGQPLLPFLLEVHAHGAQLSADALVNYHHQLHRTTEMSLALQGTMSPTVAMGIGYTSNEFAFATPDNKEVPAGSAFTFNGAMAWTDAWRTGFTGRLNLTDGTPPLERRLDQGEVFVEYHPICYAVRVSYSEQVASTLVGGLQTYYLDRRFRISFDLSGLVGGPVQAPSPLPGSPSYTAAADATPPAQCHS